VPWLITWEEVNTRDGSSRRWAESSDLAPGAAFVLRLGQYRREQAEGRFLARELVLISAVETTEEQAAAINKLLDE